MYIRSGSLERETCERSAAVARLTPPPESEQRGVLHRCMALLP